MNTDEHSNCHVDKFVNDRQEDLSNRFQGLRSVRIPYGTYTYLVKLPKTEIGLPRTGKWEPAVSAQVSVNLQNNLVVIRVAEGTRLGFAVDGTYPPGFVILGRLKPMPTLKRDIEPVWIRLTSIYGEDHLDVVVEETGDFRIYRPLSGRYILLVIRGDELLHSQPVQFERSVRSEGAGSNDFVVNLPKVPPEALFIRSR